MSHFTTIVCLPPTVPSSVQDAVERVLAPYDENTDVAPYHDYESAWQDTYAAALKWFGDKPQHKPAGLDEMDVAAVLSAYQGETVHEETKDGKVAFYTVSTYNPRSKWDWWVIGGRWRGYFPVKGEHDGDPRLIVGEPGAFNNPAIPHCADAGPRGLLDLDARRRKDGAKAAAQYDQWESVTRGLPKGQPWSHFLDRHKADEQGYSIDRAREEYRRQARVQAALNDSELRWVMDPIGYFNAGRDALVEGAAQKAVPGYAYVDLDGQWQAPGRMGWFGMSSENDQDLTAHLARANAYLDNLPSDTWLVAVDCHI